MPKGRINKVKDAHIGAKIEAAVPQVEDHKVVEVDMGPKVEVAIETPVEEVKAPISDDTVTLTAADPKVKLEVSINGEIWSGNSITIPKSKESDVRRLLNDAGMYVKN